MRCWAAGIGCQSLFKDSMHRSILKLGGGDYVLVLG
jgi:hypothetical protein